ncbi:MAG: tRNA (adenosine(37)-N6)-threonylcarbamoyltransferase complex dimerization subunit type 1 TsaB [Verrucomicrobia bacterium]|nr:tRNA (adenosine(37)-N6)-threonylcarbamoyltransferase complex dimerization subunit type 1 TsaB [Verrucomicrobiota bacterium]
MKILALEFSSPQRSAAVVEGGTGASPVTLGSVRASDDPQRRGLALVDAALREARVESEEITCLAIGLGPGSYTGIRSAIAIAQGWQLARAVKLVGISSVECLAVQAQTDGTLGRVNIVIDAQRREFYLAGYAIAATECREVEPLHLATFEEVERHSRAGALLIGPEVTRWFPTGRVLFPDAATLGRLAAGRTDFAQGEDLEPIYLRQTSFVKAPPPRVLPQGL